MTTSDAVITIGRAELAPAAERLAQRLRGVGDEEVEAALWQWLQQATAALVADGDAYAGREAHGFLPQAFHDKYRTTRPDRWQGKARKARRRTPASARAQGRHRDGDTRRA